MPDGVNRVRINLPAVCNGMRPPNPGEPVITVDGVEIAHPLAIQITAAGGAATKVVLQFFAEVEGDVDTIERPDDDELN